MVRGDWIDPVRSRLTVGRMAEVWLPCKSDLKAPAAATTKACGAHGVKPSWNDVPVASVSYADAIAWKAAMAVRSARNA